MSKYVSKKLTKQFKNINKLYHLSKEINELDEKIDVCESALNTIDRCSVGGKFRVYEEDEFTGELILITDSEQEALEYYKKILIKNINKIHKKKIKFDVLYKHKG